MPVPALGVGLTYWPRLAPFLAEFPDAVDVVEFQPETAWLPSAAAGMPFSYDAGALADVQALPYPVIAHGVNFPIGGARPPDPRHLPPLREMLDALDAPWASEHLAYNVAGDAEGTYGTGFMLPSRQTPEGATTAAAHARAVADALGRPFAVEPGVSYLRPRADELPDGEYVAAVLAESGCGLLLDLHNVWTNARNGRQPVAEFLAAIPFDRVWEVHLAGGREHDGYWLDAHSDVVPDAVMGLARDVVPDLPNLGAIVFELLPSFYDGVGPVRLRAQLDAVRDVWALRRAPDTAWDDALGALVVGRTPSPSVLADDLATDPGLAVFTMLVGELRGSMLARALKLTVRLLLLSLGEAATRDLMTGYWAAATPALFAAEEAEGFAAYLRAHGPRLPYLDDVLAFELALLRGLVSGESATVEFGFDPETVLGALADGRLPASPAPGRYPVAVET